MFHRFGLRTLSVISSWKLPLPAGSAESASPKFLQHNLNSNGMSQPISLTSWPAGIPEIRLHPTDLSRYELPEEAKGWLLFVWVRKSVARRPFNRDIRHWRPNHCRKNPSQPQPPKMGYVNGEFNCCHLRSLEKYRADVLKCRMFNYSYPITKFLGRLDLTFPPPNFCSIPIWTTHSRARGQSHRSSQKGDLAMLFSPSIRALLWGSVLTTSVSASRLNNIYQDTISFFFWQCSKQQQLPENGRL